MHSKGNVDVTWNVNRILMGNAWRTRLIKLGYNLHCISNISNIMAGRIGNERSHVLSWAASSRFLCYHPKLRWPFKAILLYPILHGIMIRYSPTTRTTEQLWRYTVPWTKSGHPLERNRRIQWNQNGPQLEQHMSGMFFCPTEDNATCRGWTACPTCCSTNKFGWHINLVSHS